MTPNSLLKKPGSGPIFGQANSTLRNPPNRKLGPDPFRSPFQRAAKASGRYSLTNRNPKRKRGETWNPRSLRLRFGLLCSCRSPNTLRQVALLLLPILIGSLVAGASTRCEAAAGTFESPEQAVEGGREALDRWNEYPWYDREKDDVRAVNITPPAPPAPPQTTWDWSGLFEFIRVLGWALLALMLAVLVYLLVRAFIDPSSTAMAPTARRVLDETTDLDRVEALPFHVRRPDSDLLSEARRNFLDGNYDEAIIYLYSYQLVELDKSQIIRLTRGKTNRQYLREVRRGSSLGDLLEQTMVAFEDVFFGGHALSRARFEASWSQLDEFHRALQRDMA